MVGLRDNRVSEKLQLDPDLALKRALTQTRQHEGVKLQQSVIRGQKSESVDTVKLKRDRKASTKHSSLQKCKRCGGNNHPKDKCPAKDSICHKCSVKGHWVKFCLSKPKINEVYVNSDVEEDLDFLGQSRSTSPTIVLTQWNPNHGSQMCVSTGST